MRFKKPPLIELVAEFRWNPEQGPGGLALQPGRIAQVPIPDPNRFESFFSGFSKEIGKAGYVRAERLIPQGWPFPSQVPVVRFRQSDDETTQTLYQVGGGIFSAHALPPYKSWEEFKPVIMGGLVVLLNAIPADERAGGFTTITLRYIDRFSPQLIGDRSPREFIRDVLNIQLDFPEVLKAEATDEDAINPTLLLKVPLKSGLLMTLGINPPNVPDPGIVMDTSVVTQASIQMEVASAEAMLGVAHDSIRRLFMGLTAPIAANMEPERQ